MCVPQATLGVSKEITYLQGGQSTYDIEIDVDLGTTSGLEMNITNAIPSTISLSQGMNTFSITPNSSSSIISILPMNNSQTHTFTINFIQIIKINSTLDVTKDDIEQVIDYYPYGKVLREEVLGDDERFLTTQHERDQSTGLDYRGARYYDADVARFLSLDPLASQFPSWTDYNYVMGNPVMFIDPDGRAPQDWVKSFETGEYTWDESAKDQNSSPAGTRYIGDENSDIVKDLFGQTRFNEKTYVSGMSHVTNNRGGTAGSFARVYTTLNVSISANISYDGTNRKFNGINVNASGGSWTYATTNIFQRFDFITKSLTLNNKEMSQDAYQPNSIGPQTTTYKTADIKSHTGTMNAQEVYSARNSSTNISVSLFGQSTFADTPIKGVSAFGLITPPKTTSLSSIIPFKN